MKVVDLTQWYSPVSGGIRTYLLAPLGVRTPMLGDTDTEWARTAAGPIAEPEDVALSAFNSLCRGLENGRFPKLQDRDDLWRLLVVIAAVAIGGGIIYGITFAMQ